MLESKIMGNNNVSTRSVRFIFCGRDLGRGSVVVAGKSHLGQWDTSGHKMGVTDGRGYQGIGELHRRVLEWSEVEN